MHKPKKLHTQSGRENKRSLRITQSPKRVTKLKLGVLLQAGKEKDIQHINEVVRHKLEENPQSSHKSPQRNPYEFGYQTDTALWKQYCEATERYEHAGISLKWPYYFSSSSKSKE